MEERRASWQAYDYIFGEKHSFRYGLPQSSRQLELMYVPPVHDGFMQRYLASGERRLLGKPRILKGAVKKDGTPITCELSLGKAPRPPAPLPQRTTPTHTQPDSQSHQCIGEVFEGDQRRFLATMRVLPDDGERPDDSSSDTDVTYSESPSLSDDEEKDTDDDEEEEVVEKFQENLDLHVRAMKESLLADFKEVAHQLAQANEDLRSIRREKMEMKRKLVRMELTNEATKKILSQEWGADLRALKHPVGGGGDAEGKTRSFPDVKMALEIKPSSFCFMSSLKVYPPSSLHILLLPLTHFYFSFLVDDNPRGRTDACGHAPV